MSVTLPGATDEGRTILSIKRQLIDERRIGIMILASEITEPGEDLEVTIVGINGGADSLEAIDNGLGVGISFLNQAIEAGFMFEDLADVQDVDDLETLAGS